MAEKDDPQVASEYEKAGDFQRFAKVMSGYIATATTALRERDFDAGLALIERAIRACEASPGRALVSQGLALLEALAITAEKEVPMDRSARASALRKRVVDFRRLRMH